MNKVKPLTTASNKNMNGCLIYIRVSDESQIETFSLDNQYDYCKKFADNKGYQILETFREEGKSARNLNRPELQKLLAYARKNQGDITAVILYRYDRLSRNILEALQVRKQLSELGIRVLSATEPVSDDPLGELFQSLSFLFAQYESSVHKKRVTDGLHKRFSEGYYTSGFCPLGYKKERNGKQVLVVPDKDFKVIQQAWRLYATGTKSTQEIADFLNSQNVRQNLKHKFSKVYKNSISKMLRNKFYIGILTSRTFGEAQGKHIPMIDTETFNRVQFLLEGKAQTPYGSKNMKNNPDFYLRGYLNCECGRKLTAANSRGRLGKLYGYYFCMGHRKNNYPSKLIHDEFKKLMDGLTFSQNAFGLYSLILEIKYKRKIKLLEKRMKDIQDAVLDIKKQRITLAEKNSQGIICDEIYKALDKELADKMIIKEVCNSDGLIQKYELENIIKFSNSIFTNLYKAYLASDEGQRRFLLGKLFPEGLIWNKKDFSNTTIHPIFREIQEVCTSPESLSGRRVSIFEHISYLHSLYQAYPDYTKFSFLFE